MNGNGKEQSVVIEKTRTLFKILSESLNYSELFKLWNSVQCLKQEITLLHQEAKSEKIFIASLQKKNKVQQKFSGSISVTNFIQPNNSLYAISLTINMKWHKKARCARASWNSTKLKRRIKANFTPFSTNYITLKGQFTLIESTCPEVSENHCNHRKTQHLSHCLLCSPQF